jgi:stringent starvation protein A
MPVIANKRSVMTLYSDASDIYSHRVRIVLAEKGVNVEIIDVLPEALPQEVLEGNPYQSLPTLLDRELVLFKSRIIMEYLDERFPHPPLLPVYPVARAEKRLTMLRIERDWYALVHRIEKGDHKAKTELRDSLVTMAPLFTQFPYFMNEEFSLLDCCLGPLLWRLPLLGVELPEASTKPIAAYMERIFERDSFQKSLTELEREIREHEYV